MNKFVLFLLIIFGSLSLFAQQKPVMKIYQTDGSTKQYDIDSIADISFIHSNLSYSMSIFQKSNIRSDIDIRNIDSIIYENSQIMKVIQSGDTKTFNISEIDSIIFALNTCTEIQIGTQIWMCKNLDVDHYSNGDPIPQVTDETEWANLKTGAWCYYNNDPSMGAIYGKLYNWYAVNDSRGLAPSGWHVPSHDEWTTLTNYLGGQSVAGGKMKETGTAHWYSPNTGATNSSGFSALPGGYRSISGAYIDIGDYGFWWSSTESSATDAWGRFLGYSSADVDRHGSSKGYGFSVRCVRDN